MRPVFSLVFLAAFLAVVTATNYCSRELCSPGYRHIGCGHNNLFDRTCPRDARLLDLRRHVNKILNMHNKLRNRIAGGGMKKYKPAARMATMQWDKELADLAALNVKQCKMQHDACHNTDTFKYSGQNLATKGYMGSTYKDVDLIKWAIKSWFGEHKDARMKFIDRYPENYSGPVIGHFTEMVIDSNIRVGCAAARYSEGEWQHFLFACNYARINIYGRPIYESSDRPASKCETGTNPKFSNLCSTDEVYNETVLF